MLRDRRQIEDILQHWPDGFFNRFGREITREELIKFLDDLLRKKEEKALGEQFGSFEASELRSTIECLKSGEFSKISSKKKRA